MAERNETPRKKETKMNTIISPAPGMYFDATRTDGRRFTGEIAKVADVKGRTMLVVKIGPQEFKSVYLDDCKGYLMSDTFRGTRSNG